MVRQTMHRDTGVRGTRLIVINGGWRPDFDPVAGFDEAARQLPRVVAHSA